MTVSEVSDSGGVGSGEGGGGDEVMATVGWEVERSSNNSNGESSSSSNFQRLEQQQHL